MNIPRFDAIETQRLRIRRLTEEDIPNLLSYRNDPNVARYQSWEHIDEQEARALIRDMEDVEPGMRGVYFQFAIALRTSDEIIGDAMLFVTADDNRLGEIGYSFARAHQGKGYAIESLHALLDYAFKELDLHRVTALVDTRNIPSIRLLERLGMRREGEFIENAWFKGEWCNEYLYAVLQREWLPQLT
jgi:RimJ/RimL family protein N-acetyltransferase